MNKKCIQYQNIFNLQQYKVALKSTIQRLYDNNTVEAALLEMKQLLINYGQIGKQERLAALCDLLLENTSKLSTKQKKDTIKILSIIGEVYQKYTFIAWNRVCKVISKKICDEDANTYLILAENVGNLVQKSFQIDDDDLTFEEGEIKLFWSQLLALYFSLISNTASSMSDKKKSVASSMCLSISIQSVPQKIILRDRIDVCLQLMKPMQRDTCAVENQLLDCLLSLIVACEEQFEDCCEFCVPFVIELLVKEQNQQLQSQINNNAQHNNTTTSWQKRKICIDIIYTLSVLTPAFIALYKDQCLELVNSFKYDKIKNVREAASVAIISLQDLPYLKEQKYVQTTSSENLSSTSREKYLLSSQKEESSMNRNSSLQNFKNLSNIEKNNDQVEIQEKNEDEENQDEEADGNVDQSDTQMPELVDIALDREEIDEALEKLKQLQERDELQQKQQILQAQLNQGQGLQQTNNAVRNNIEVNEKKPNGSGNQIPGLKRLSPDYKQSLLVKKDMKFEGENNNNQKKRSKTRTELNERAINQEFMKNAPKTMIELKLKKPKEQVEDGEKNQEIENKNLNNQNTTPNSLNNNDRTNYHKNNNSLQVSDFGFQKKSNLDKDLKQIDENIKKIQSDLKVYEELLSSGEKASKDRMSASPEKNNIYQATDGYISPPNHLQQSMEEIDQKEKSLPRNSSFSPSRNYMAAPKQKKRLKIFETSPLSSTQKRSLSNTNRMVGGTPIQNSGQKQMGYMNNASIISNNPIQIQDSQVRRTSPKSPSQSKRNFMRPQSISPQQSTMPYIPQQYTQPTSQGKYKPIFQQPPIFNRSASSHRMNSFDQQASKLSESHQGLNHTQTLNNNEVSLYKDRIKFLEEENMMLKAQLNEKRNQMEQLERKKDEQYGAQINELNKSTQGLVQQLNSALAERKALLQEHSQKEQNLQSTIHQLNVQISDLKNRIEQLLSQQIEQGTISSHFSMGQQNNMRFQNSKVGEVQNNFQVAAHPQFYEYNQNQPVMGLQRQQQQHPQMMYNNTQIMVGDPRKTQTIDQNKANTLKRVPQQQIDSDQIASQLVRRDEQFQQTTKQWARSISPLERIDTSEYQQRAQQHQENTAKFCANNQFTFDVSEEDPNNQIDNYQNGYLADSNNTSNKNLSRNDSALLKNQTYKHEILTSFAPENSFVPSSSFWRDQFPNEEAIKQINWGEGEVSLIQFNKTMQKVDQAINVSNNTITQIQFTQNTKNDERFNQNIEKKEEVRKRSLLDSKYKEIHLYESIDNQEKMDKLRSIQQDDNVKKQTNSQLPKINILVDSQTKFQQNRINSQQYDTDQQRDKDQFSSQKKRSLNPYQQSMNPVSENTKQTVEAENNSKGYQTENINKIFEYLQGLQSKEIQIYS